ncbi:hypothetical protein B0H34DRAFT_779767 [Crassisporium funariophilum]|nr:hypothetical protein B0H34DRAFT_779767 [Crassisporium funariophilum]
MSTTSYAFRRKGLLNLPGATYESRKVAEDLLLKDAQEHHCFYRAPSIHNHLAHHILAAYDLGAPASLLQKIYEVEAKKQRPILLDDKDKEIIITEKNWAQFTGNSKFRFIFAPSSNIDGANMLVRFVSGAFHPVIQVGYGIEFGDDLLVATGFLAQTAVHPPLPLNDLINFENPPDATHNKSSREARQVSRGPSLLELLRQVYDSPILKPVVPYVPDATIYMQLKAHLTGGRPEEIRRICSQYYVDEEAGEDEYDAKLEELVWVSTLLMFATGKEGQRPRLDFFLMHLSTSTFFFHPIFKLLKNSTHKARFLRAFIPVIALITLLRGRPVIKPDLLMSYTSRPRPPLSLGSQPKPDESCIGNPLDDSDYNPWPAMVSCVVHAPDSHVLKVMRSMIFASQQYGDVRPGGAIGAFVIPLEGAADAMETHLGTSRMDGSIFVKAAGILLDYMGWISYGKPARPGWDRTGLGWDEAWDTEDCMED